MPFTFSHAAAVIPFRRTPFIMSALVMGCFVPDFPHFLSLSPQTSFSHTYEGMFLIDLPLALLALWLFHAFIKRPMLMFLPSGFRRRLRTSVNSFAFWPTERFSLIILSILIGITTHMVWDAFTHRTFWPYQHWAFLRSSVDLPVTGAMKMYLLLEYASSVVGLVIVAVWIWHWYRTTKPSVARIVEPEEVTQRRNLVAVLPAIAILGGAVRAYHHEGLHFQIRPLVHFTADTIISAITFFLLGLLVYGVVLRQRRVAHVSV
jgi:hypothetical protein